MDNAIGVQMTQDPNVHAYHTKVELTDKQAESGARGCTDDVGELTKMILEIRGIERVIMTPYTVLVGKGLMFEWQEIEANVLDVLKSYTKTVLGIRTYTIEELDRESQKEQLKPQQESDSGKSKSRRRRVAPAKTK